MALLIASLSAAILVYVFIIYPTLILLLDSRETRPVTPRWTELPSVTMVFSAHNEEQSVSQKLENSLSLNYPEDKFNIIVVDDGSTDHTAEVIEKFESNRVNLVKLSKKGGKTAALNQAVKVADGEVLVFTDANSIYHSDAILHLVRLFDSDGKIGVVSGILKYQQHPEAVSDEESRYWRMEVRLKEAESNLGSMLGAVGSIYAMPRDLFEPLREDLISDFITPLLLAKKGYRTVFQPKAVTVEMGTRSLRSEFRRKKRIVQRGLYGLLAHKELINPFASGMLAIKLWSHKVMRWLTPIWLLVLLFSTWTLQEQAIFSLLLYLQLLGYAMGSAGLLIHLMGIKPGILRFPAYVLMTLGAAISGVWGALTGKKVVTWEPQR